MAYNPNKLKTVKFLTNLELTNDTTVSEEVNLLLKGDYNENYLNQKESESIHTVLVRNNSSPANASLPTRCTDVSKIYYRIILWLMMQTVMIKFLFSVAQSNLITSQLF